MSVVNECNCPPLDGKVSIFFFQGTRFFLCFLVRTSCELYRTCLLCSAGPFPLHLCFPPGVLLELHRKSGQKNPRFLFFCWTQTSQAADVQARPLQQPGAPLTFLRFKLSNDESCTGPDEHIGKFQKFLIQVRTAQTRHLERPLPRPLPRPPWRPNPSMHPLQPSPHPPSESPSSGSRNFQTPQTQQPRLQ